MSSCDFIRDLKGKHVPSPRTSLLNKILHRQEEAATGRSDKQYGHHKSHEVLITDLTSPSASPSRHSREATTGSIDRQYDKKSKRHSRSEDNLLDIAQKQPGIVGQIILTQDFFSVSCVVKNIKLL